MPNMKGKRKRRRNNPVKLADFLFTTHAMTPKSAYCTDPGSNFANMADQFWLNFFRTHVHDPKLAILFTVIG